VFCRPISNIRIRTNLEIDIPIQRKRIMIGFITSLDVTAFTPALWCHSLPYVVSCMCGERKTLEKFRRLFVINYDNFANYCYMFLSPSSRRCYYRQQFLQLWTFYYWHLHLSEFCDRDFNAAADVHHFPTVFCFSCLWFWEHFNFPKIAHLSNVLEFKKKWQLESYASTSKRCFMKLLCAKLHLDCCCVHHV